MSFVCMCWPTGEVVNTWGQRFRVRVYCDATIHFLFIQSNILIEPLPVRTISVSVILLWFYSALEFLATCKLANLTVRAELGCCLLHRGGRLTIDGCILQCESNPLDHLSHAIVTTASPPDGVPAAALKKNGDCVTVMRTRIEGGAKAVLTSGTLSLQQVRVIYTRTSLFFWFSVEQTWDRTNLWVRVWPLS